MDFKQYIPEMSLAEKASLFCGKGNFTTHGIRRFGIPSLLLADGPHGLRRQAESSDHLGLHESLPATCYPTAAAAANSWDVHLLEEIGRHLGREARAQGVSVILGPGLNIKRSPLGGRNFEYFSEDPYLSGKLAAAMIRGIQEEGVAACPKHFAVNSQETLRQSSDAVIDERALREIYLSAFEIAVKEGKPYALMSSYNRVNGIYANENQKLLQEILRDEWGYEGFTLSDWGGSNERVAGLIAGNHLEMPGTCGQSILEIMEAVRNGEISEELLDRRAAEYLDVLERLEPLPAEQDRSFDVEAHHAFARKAAAESMVLLKNEGGLLPLDRDCRPALIGRTAAEPRYQGAGSSKVRPTRTESVRELIRAWFPNCTGYEEGFAATRRDEKKHQENIFRRPKNLPQEANACFCFWGCAMRMRRKAGTAVTCAWMRRRRSFWREWSKRGRRLS